MAELRTKTIFCDIDGTLLKHIGYSSQQLLNIEPELLPNALNAINNWDSNGYNVILTTGRKESMRQKTIQDLNKLGIVYDQLIMGIGGGPRVLINDKKYLTNTAYCVNVVRNSGMLYFDFSNLPKITLNDNEELITQNNNYIIKKITMYPNSNTSIMYND